MKLSKMVGGRKGGMYDTEKLAKIDDGIQIRIYFGISLCNISDLSLFTF